MPLSLKHIRKSSSSSICSRKTSSSSSTMGRSISSPTFSFASASTITPPQTPRSDSSSSHRRSRTLDFNPLSFHPVNVQPASPTHTVCHAPPRLHDRPYLFTPSVPKSPSSTLSIRSHSTSKIIFQKPRSLPQHLTVVYAVEEKSSFDYSSDTDSFLDEDEVEDEEDEEDIDQQNSELVQQYYSTPSRPVLRSHWSESTIASYDSEDDEDTINDEEVFDRSATEDSLPVTITSIENADEHQQYEASTKTIVFPSLPIPPYPADFYEDSESEVEDRDFSPLSPVSERAPTPHPQPAPATNFSRKRETVPQTGASSFAADEAVEERFRRNGWKRCGVIFGQANGELVVPSRIFERNSSPGVF